MAGGYRVAPDGDFGVLVQRLERAERRLAELERPSGSQTAEALRQLNNAVVTNFASSGTLNQNNTSTPVDNLDAASITFTRPSWATRATVLASGLLFAGGTFNSPASVVGRLRIAGVDGPTVALSSPILADVFDAGIPNGMQAAVGQNVRTLFAARTFDTSAASFTVTHRVDLDVFGTGSSVLANVGATVFWSAP